MRRQKAGHLGQGHSTAIRLPQGFGALCPGRRLVQPPLARKALVGIIRLREGFGPPRLGRGRMGDPHWLNVRGRRECGVGHVGGAGRRRRGATHVHIGRGLKMAGKRPQGLRGLNGIVKLRLLVQGSLARVKRGVLVAERSRWMRRAPEVLRMTAATMMRGRCMGARSAGRQLPARGDPGAMWLPLP